MKDVVNVLKSLLKHHVAPSVRRRL
jgi:hypothetical protein